MPYTPTIPPQTNDTQELLRWVFEEFRRISVAGNETIAVELRQVGRAPDKPREGMIVSANGTTWNPGAGAGAYEYKGGAWVKL